MFFTTFALHYFRSKNVLFILKKCTFRFADYTYNPSFREEITTYAAQVLKLTHYKVCLQLSVRRIIGNIGLVKDLDTGTYYYVVQDTSAQKKNEFFHFTSEELKSE